MEATTFFCAEGRTLASECGNTRRPASARGGKSVAGKCSGAVAAVMRKGVEAASGVPALMRRGVALAKRLPSRIAWMWTHRRSLVLIYLSGVTLLLLHLKNWL